MLILLALAIALPTARPAHAAPADSPAADNPNAHGEALFDSPPDAQRELAVWHYDYNNAQPHSAVGDRTPARAHRRASTNIK